MTNILTNISLSNGRKLSNRYTIIEYFWIDLDSAKCKFIEAYTKKIRERKLSDIQLNGKLKVSTRNALKFDKLRDRLIVMDNLLHEIIKFRDTDIAFILCKKVSS